MKVSLNDHGPYNPIPIRIISKCVSGYRITAAVHWSVDYRGIKPNFLMVSIDFLNIRSCFCAYSEFSVSSMFA